MSAPRVLAAQHEIAELAGELARAPRLAFDLESNGLFAYRARVCMMQLARGAEVVIVDPLAVDPAPLARVLGDDGPVKVVHDVAFDARMLAEIALPLGNVHDTSIAARMLGRTATGLASLLGAELGITVDKALQHHDWSERPLRPEHIDYLASDVLHLEQLDDKLWGEARAKGIEEEILEETRYRLRAAVTAVSTPDPQPAWTRMKGIERLRGVEVTVARRVWDARDREAARLDVPPYKVMGNEVIVEIAQRRPTSAHDLARIRGATHGRAQAMAKAILRAVDQGVADGKPTDEERAWLERPRVPSDVAKARRARETRVMAWRKAEATRRGVDEQVVLPGHCVKDIAERALVGVEEVKAVDGFGACRARYADEIVAALRGDAAASGASGASGAGGASGGSDGDGPIG